MLKIEAPVGKKNLDPAVSAVNDREVHNPSARPLSQSITQASFLSFATGLDRTVFYSHVHPGTENDFTLPVLGLVVGRPQAIAVCLIDLDPQLGSLHQHLFRWRTFIDAARDGAILPVIRSALSDCGEFSRSDSAWFGDIEGALKTCGYLAFVVRGEGFDEVNEMLQAKICAAFGLIKTFQQNARRTGSAYSTPRWPAILIG